VVVYGLTDPLFRRDRPYPPTYPHTHIPPPPPYCVRLASHGVHPSFCWECALEQTEQQAQDMYNAYSLRMQGTQVYLTSLGRSEEIDQFIIKPVAIEMDARA
jgi:hypothetical protein